MKVATVLPVSPELALVCPDLRQQALALLPTVDPEALFRCVPRAVEPVRDFVQDTLVIDFTNEWVVPASLTAARSLGTATYNASAADPPHVPTPIAVAVYTASRVLQFGLGAAASVTAVTVLSLVATLAG